MTGKKANPWNRKYVIRAIERICSRCLKGLRAKHRTLKGSIQLTPYSDRVEVNYNTPSGDTFIGSLIPNNYNDAEILTELSKGINAN